MIALLICAGNFFFVRALLMKLRFEEGALLNLELSLLNVLFQQKNG